MFAYPCLSARAADHLDAPILVGNGQLDINDVYAFQSPSNADNTVLIMTVNPRVVLLGTIAVHAGERLLAPVRERLARYAWPRAREACTVAAATLGIRLASLGALAVAHRAWPDEPA